MTDDMTLSWLGKEDVVEFEFSIVASGDVPFGGMGTSWIRIIWRRSLSKSFPVACDPAIGFEKEC